MASLRGQLARSTEKRGGVGQRNVVESGEVEVPFIGLERRGGSRLEELNGGQGVHFEVSRFEDEGDTVRRRFIGQKDGGQAALRFGSPRMEESAASGGARCGNCDDGPPWRGGPRWATAMAGRKNEKKNWKEPMGFNGARAELRWTEKEKK
jgi:hypothetical protein